MFWAFLSYFFYLTIFFTKLEKWYLRNNRVFYLKKEEKTIHKYLFDKIKNDFSHL